MPLAREIIYSKNKKKNSFGPQFRIGYVVDTTDKINKDGSAKTTGDIWLLVDEDKISQYGIWPEIARIKLGKTQLKRLASWLLTLELDKLRKIKYNEKGYPSARIILRFFGEEV